MPVEQRFEATLAAPFTVSGRGLHTNRPARVTVEPARARHGIRFHVAGTAPVALSWQSRAASRFNTALRLSDGGLLRTVEHLAAALSAFGIDNALVRAEGREIPIFDGSARAWCARLAEAGSVAQAEPRRILRIVRPIQVVANGRFVRAQPADEADLGTCLDVTCEPFYGRGTLRWRGPLSREAFVADLAGSRSSGQVSRLWEFGPIADRLLAPLLRPIGGGDPAPSGQAPNARPNTRPNTPLPDLPNALAPDIAGAMRNPVAREPVLRGLRPGRAAIHLGPFVLGGARYPDERVRHNALDLIGDLRLAGAPLLGRIVTHRPTHKLTYAFVASLMRQPDAWEFQSP